MSMKSYFGLAHCTVVPPPRLYHPVLPYVSCGKLKFPLCRTCADRESYHCRCTQSQRAITGTWCTPELQTAVRKGYRVVRVYEVYHWKETSVYDPEAKQGGLFSPYIRMFLKIKQESSGWPSHVKTEEDKLRYIRAYMEHEGVQLEYQNIVKNPGKRQLAKICLNSFVSTLPSLQI